MQHAADHGALVSEERPQVAVLAVAIAALHVGERRRDTERREYLVPLGDAAGLERHVCSSHGRPVNGHVS
jgi:hypothetical protein